MAEQKTMLDEWAAGCAEETLGQAIASGNEADGEKSITKPRRALKHS